MDAATAIVTIAAIDAGKDVAKDLIIRVLGPTADYWGEGLKNLNQKAAQNIGRIFHRGSQKLSQSLENKGSVPPRIAKEIFEEGAFCENDVLVEYYSGILASSRTEDGSDDRMIPVLSLIKSMSTAQLRTHYILYSLFRSLFIKTKNNLQISTEAAKLLMLLPLKTYGESMNSKPPTTFDITIPHCLFALANKDLIQPNYAFGSQKFLLSQYPEYTHLITEEGIIVAPSVLGAELFLAAHGVKNRSTNAIFDDSCLIDPFSDLPILGNARSLDIKS
jgi:hypothetical protein